jgi:hypothetical protein
MIIITDHNRGQVATGFAPGTSGVAGPRLAC